MFSAIQLSGIQNICGQTLEFDENRDLSIVMLSDNSLISCSLTVKFVLREEKSQGPSLVFRAGHATAGIKRGHWCKSSL